MASVGKKLAMNFAKGRTALKPNFPRKIGHTRDELDGDSLAGGKRKDSHDSLSANISVGTPLYKGSKSNSMGSVHSDAHEGPMDHEQIVLLTHYVRTLSEALGHLKEVFANGGTGSQTAEELRVEAHEKLGDVLGILKEILQKYPSLHTTDVLTTAAMLITKIKSSHYEEVSQDSGSLLYMIDQLSLAFSTSVSDFLMGDIDNFPPLGKTKSYDNLASDSALDDQSTSPEKGSQEPEDDIDGVLQRLEAHGGVDRALLQAKLWSKYVKEIITYVEKKNALENEYSKNLNKLANSLKNSVMKETFLPMQAIFCTAFDQDMDFSAATQATATIVQTQKFVEPLNARRSEHEKNRKHLKDTWAKELKRMQESISNLHKAKSNYIARQQEHEKARDSTQKTENENLSSSTAGQLTKLEKKRKLEEEALYKCLEAETTYKACVAEANHRQKELEKVKCKILAEVRDLIYHSDQIMKQVTVAYFQLLHTLSAPKPVQFQTLCEASYQYDPGSQYVEYVKRIHVPSDLVSAPEPFVFEPYTPESKLHELRKIGHVDDSVLYKDGKHSHTLKVHGEEDTDSVSDSSSRSQESSPTASPCQSHRHVANSLPMSKLGDADRVDPRVGVVSERARITFRGVELSPAARTHLFKKLRTLSKCRQCESYVYFQGAECEWCGLSSHKKCLESLHWECGHQSVRRRMTTFGVDFSEHVQETHTDIPRLVWKCTKEIDERGLDIKGIYRVSGVKSKVESLCQGFEMDESNVDLSEHHPNVIANVLKLYLRQLPEPLVSFKLYPQFIRLAKEEQQAGGGQGPASPEVIQRLKSFVHALSTAQFRTCGHLMHHLKRVTETQEINQMSAYNIGVVFGPTLLRQSEDAVSLDSLLDTPCQTRIVELLILNVDTIFGTEEQFRPLQDKEASSPVAAKDILVSLADDTDAEARSPPVGEAGKGFTENGKPTRLVPEITRDLVTGDNRLTAPGSPPTLLMIANTKSPRSDGEPASPGPSSPNLTQESFVAEESFNIEGFTDSFTQDGSTHNSCPPTGVTLQYKNVMSPPHTVVKGPSLSTGSLDIEGFRSRTADQGESPSTNRSPGMIKKKILPSQVISRTSPRSRDSSPSEHIKIPPLTRPQPFTPPTHRRLCRTGTGGLLEHPVTPDPLHEESDSDDLDDRTNTSDTSGLKPYTLVFDGSLTKSRSVPNILDAPDDSPMQSTSTFYRETPDEPPITLPSPIDIKPTDHDGLVSTTDELFPVKSPGARSTFYTPSPRRGRRHSLEPVGSLAMGSPASGRRNVLPKDDTRLPKYV